MTYHLFSTLCNDADAFLDNTLISLSKGDISIYHAMTNLKKIEEYDVLGEPFFRNADMTKETKYEFVECICRITNSDENSIWDIYDSVYNQ